MRRIKDKYFFPLQTLYETFGAAIVEARCRVIAGSGNHTRSTDRSVYPGGEAAVRFSWIWLFRCCKKLSMFLRSRMVKVSSTSPSWIAETLLTCYRIWTTRSHGYLVSFLQKITNTVLPFESPEGGVFSCVFQVKWKLKCTWTFFHVVATWSTIIFGSLVHTSH